MTPSERLGIIKGGGPKQDRPNCAECGHAYTEHIDDDDPSMWCRHTTLNSGLVRELTCPCEQYVSYGG